MTLRITKLLYCIYTLIILKERNTSEENKKIRELYNEENPVDIDINNLKKEEVDELLGNLGKSEVYDGNVKQLFNDKRNVNCLKLYINQYISYLSEDFIKNLFSILTRYNIELVFTDENLVKLLEDAKYNSKFTTIIKLLNSKGINEIVRNLKTKNGFNNLLLCIDKNRLSEISLNKIDISVIIESLEDEKFFKELESIIYSNSNNIKYCFLLKQLDNKKTNEFLSKLNLDEEIKKISYKNLEMDDISYFIEKTKDIDFVRKCFMEIDDEKISRYEFSEYSVDILAELIKTLDENDPVFKKVILINCYHYNDTKYLVELLDKIGKENVIKLLNNVPYNRCFIGTSIILEKLRNIVGDEKIVKKRILREKIFTILRTKRSILMLENNYDILEETLKELKDEEITEINLSYICSNKNGELGGFIKKIIDEYPSNRIPQFNIDAISEFDLFKAIKKGKIKNTNIQKPENKPKSKCKLLFLTGVEGFNIAQSIIKGDNFFARNPETGEVEYNKEFLKDLYDKLDNKEILSFFEFYYENSGKKEYFGKEELEEKLKKGLEDITSVLEVDLFNSIKKGVKNVDILGRLQPKLLFLSSGEKFNIVQKIIAEDNLFVENSETKMIEYNKEALSKLYSKLSTREMLLFFEFYYNNSEKMKQFSEGKESKKKLKEGLKEELKEELKGIYKGIKATDMLLKDFFNSNSKLETKKDPNGYRENRERIKRLKEIENREEIFRINYNSKNINKPANEKEELEYIIRQYHYETLRRAIVDYSRRVEPFVKKHFDSKNAEEITRNIEDALGTLFHPDSSNTFKLEAQKILRENIDKIGEEYKKFMEEKKEIDILSGSHLMFSSICNAESINELQEALYSHVRMKMVNDYVQKHSFGNDGNKGKKTLLEIGSDKLFRAYGSLNEEELKEAIDNFTCSPIAQTGRKQYKTFDMITREENEKNGNSVNIKCGKNETRDSLAGSFTSFSNKSKNIKGYATSILSVYAPTENFKKSLFTDVANRNVSEIVGFDILSEDITMNIIQEKDKLKVVFNTNMDFITFKLRENIKVNERIYEAGKYISRDDLEYIITNKYKTISDNKLDTNKTISDDKLDITNFLDNNLIIEKSFSKNQILGGEKEIREENEEEKSKKTFETEKRMMAIKERTKAKIHPFYEKEITPIEKNDDDIHTYIIPDVHGALDEFIEDLKEMKLITVNENEFVWYKIDDSGFEVPIYEKPEDYEINKNNYIQIPRFTINKNFNGRVIQLGDLVDSHEDSTKSKECLAISILLSKQLGEKYTTLIGNHEIAKLCGNKYDMDKDNVAYEVSVIREAIKDGTIKLFHHALGTNIINSHVPLFKDNILNFLNDTVLQHNDVYEYCDEKINRLLEIIGAVKNGKDYEIDNNKCLLDKIPPEEKDIKAFVDILNELLIVTVGAGLEMDLLRTLVNDNRLYKDQNGRMRLKDVPYEELLKHIFGGIINIIGHDATPSGLRGGKYSEKLQAKAFELLHMLFTDEWQGKRYGAKFVEIRTNKKGENKVYFYKEKMEEVKGKNGEKNEEKVKEKNEEKDGKKKNTVFELYSFDGKKIKNIEEKREAEKRVEENNDLDKILYSLNSNIKTLEIRNLKEAINKTENITVSEKDKVQILGD